MARWSFVALGANLFVLAAGSITPVAAQIPSRFNQPGNILIADQFNNRVIEINPLTRQIVWQFGDGSATPGPTSVGAPNDAERINSNTLICGTGTTTTPDNRVIVVNSKGKIIWEYDDVNTPVCAVRLPNTHFLITDQGNQRIIEVDRGHQIVWQFGPLRFGGSQLNNPNSAELLENGNVLISDESNNRVIEVTHRNKIVWQYPAAPDPAKLNGAAFASRLENGNTLITDSNNNRIIEVDPSGNVVWSFVTNTRMDSIANPNPTRAIRLENGNTLISDQFNNQVIEVDAGGNIVFTYGVIANADSNPGDLNAPYDAKVIGDYNGLTPPLGFTPDGDGDGDDGGV